MELYHLRSLKDPLTSVIKDDPVRPHIPLEQRVNDDAEILILKRGEEVLAATCMQWLGQVPATENDLVDMPKGHDVAVFYTIWSYAPGAGQELIKRAASWIRTDHPTTRNIVTLSPQTRMAERFHLKNGAKIRRTNATSVNYEYYSEQLSEGSSDKIE